MKKSLCIITVFFLAFFNRSAAQAAKPDTVSVGIYVTSIHDIDFRQKEYTINCWVWLKYRNKDFDFSQNLEIPQAKTVNKSFPTTDTSKGMVNMLMKLQCVMKDSWKISRFPFDRQKLRLSIENSQYDSKSLVFVADTAGKHFGKYSISGWNVDSFNISIDKRIYETTFGDESIQGNQSEYSVYKVLIALERNNPWDLFLKIFLGMYVSFLIAYVCFYIHPDSIDARFGLSVGSLFAVIGNKYIIDSALPESASFTLVDKLHGLTLLFIFAVITSTAYSLRLVKKGKEIQARRFDMLAANILMIIYVLLNLFYII